VKASGDADTQGQLDSSRCTEKSLAPRLSTLTTTEAELPFARSSSLINGGDTSRAQSPVATSDVRPHLRRAHPVIKIRSTKDAHPIIFPFLFWYSVRNIDFTPSASTQRLPQPHSSGTLPPAWWVE
jgi:hypothetical protein